jgi:transcriptional regulator with XRE-family HTH domain
MPAPEPLHYRVTWDTSVDDGGLEEFVARLADARHNLGITQAQLSERTGLGRSQISMLENHRRAPSLGVLLRYVAGLGGSLVAHVNLVDDGAP